jgi:DNA excision repair protein ERCC-4
MASSTRICSVVTESLSTMDHDAPNGSKGRKMMMQKLRLYLWWKSQLAERKQDGLTHFAFPQVVGHASDGYNKVIGDEDGGMEISEALKRKDREGAERAGSRRRVRGGAPASVSVSKKERGSWLWWKSSRKLSALQNRKQNCLSFFITYRIPTDHF